MTISETFAEFPITTRADDLSERTVDLAAMIIASTVASAALGRNIESARIVRGLEIERGGPEASVWFESGLKLPVVGAARVNALMSDAAPSDDSDLRNIVHCGRPHRRGDHAALEITSLRFWNWIVDSSRCALGRTPIPAQLPAIWATVGTSPPPWHSSSCRADIPTRYGDRCLAPRPQG